ncbi:MAG: hypothetical protein WD153_03085 [Candidatus Paceibacterota bacterium]
MFQEIDNLISRGSFDEANALLEKLYENTNDLQKVEAVKRFAVTAKDITRIYKLSERLNEVIPISTAYGKWDDVLYFESEKLNCLVHELSMMVYRQKNLRLAENVFPWIGFALEANKDEYEQIEKLSDKLDEETQNLAKKIIEDLNRKKWPAPLIARVYLQLADYYSTMYLHYLQKYMNGGRIKSKVNNNRFIRRWNLFLYLYQSDNRKKILKMREASFKYAQLTVDEFANDSDQSGKAHALYNYAIKLNTCSKFSKALKMLEEAENTLNKSQDEFLLSQIRRYREQVKDKNRNLRDYVEELGLARPANYG